MKKHLKNSKHVMDSPKGFTLLEILVVLTIMGFLIAMVAPRLGGIADDASETVCDSNKYRIKSYVAGFYEKFDRYPNYVTNLVMSDGDSIDAANLADTGYQIPYCSDDDPDNGPEVIHSNHNKAYKFMIHRLSEEEVTELKSLGITTVYNLNDYAANADDLNGAAAAGRSSSATDGDRVTNWKSIEAITTQRPALEECTLSQGVGVAMCGMGMTLDGSAVNYVQGERGWAENDIFGRIVFGLGPESELVTSGMVANAAHSPGSLQNADNFSWSYYFLILPRLKATVDRLESFSGNFTSCWGSGNLNYDRLSSEDLKAVAWVKDNAPSGSYDISTNADNYRIRDNLGLGDAMEAWDFDTTRKRYDDVWGIDLMNANNVLNGG